MLLDIPFIFQNFFNGHLTKLSWEITFFTSLFTFLTFFFFTFLTSFFFTVLTSSGLHLSPPSASPREEKHAIPRSPSTPDSKFFTPPLRKISLVKTEKTERTIKFNQVTTWDYLVPSTLWVRSPLIYG